MSYCTKCGNEVKEGAAFCGSCGTNVDSQASKTPAVDGTVDQALVGNDNDERFPKKYLVWAAILGVVSLVGIWLFWPGVLVEGIVETVEVPLVVAKGDTFTIAVTIENLLDSEQELDSIDIGDTYLAGIAVTGSSPSFSDTWHIPFDNTMTHRFEIPIPARETITVTFSVTALTAGDYEGAFDICINGPTSCIFERVRTLVE